MRVTRIILSILICFCMASVFPITAFAADTGKAIQLGTGGISDSTEVIDNNKSVSYIYFGVNSGNSNTPIKWRVLDADKANDGTTDGMFLLSEYLLASGVNFHSNSNAYQGSDAQKWCIAFADNANNFSSAQQGAMLGIAKTDSLVYKYGAPWGESSLTKNDKLFFLSVQELADYVGGYDAAPGLAATDTAQVPGGWWLRSPDFNDLDCAGAVYSDGGVWCNYHVSLNWAARPAFNLNPKSVLFTSAAEGGKSADGMDSGLTAVTDYAGREWKPALLDSDRSSFTASAGSGATLENKYGYSDWSVSIDYSKRQHLRLQN